ncbi:MAG TPA: hypothetical protein VJX73_14405 [Terracidiphilus sp.]|nr:hypothetical protein [Terracidiphilus sp.]
METIWPVDHVAREKHDSGRLGGLIRLGSQLRLSIDDFHRGVAQRDWSG